MAKKYLIEDGDLFDGDLEQFRDNFFTNADDASIADWCHEQGYTLDILETQGATFEKLPPRLKGNPDLLALLYKGCTIKTADGYSLSGDPGSYYIRFSHEVLGSLGDYGLEPRGLKRLLDDLWKAQKADAQRKSCDTHE